MNIYYEEAIKAEMGPSLPEISALEFIEVAAVPKTPLQTTVGHVRNSAKQASSPQHRMNDPKTSNVSNDDFSTVVQRQNDIAELIIKQQNLSLLPKREVPMFDGDPLSYQSFIHALKHLIEDKTSSSQDRLYFLEQFTSGQARDLVRSCLHMEAKRGHSEATRLLKKHFGDEMKIANAYLDKALNWSSLK